MVRLLAGEKWSRACGKRNRKIKIQKSKGKIESLNSKNMVTQAIIIFPLGRVFNSPYLFRYDNLTKAADCQKKDVIIWYAKTASQKTRDIPSRGPSGMAEMAGGEP